MTRRVSLVSPCGASLRRLTARRQSKGGCPSQKLGGVAREKRCLMRRVSLVSPCLTARRQSQGGCPSQKLGGVAREKRYLMRRVSLACVAVRRLSEAPRRVGDAPHGETTIKGRLPSQKLGGVAREKRCLMRRVSLVSPCGASLRRRGASETRLTGI